ncbi:hypothetical protein V1511DRAFT_508706 [Dipodascopsis uninucleata]
MRFLLDRSLYDCKNNSHRRWGRQRLSEKKDIKSNRELQRKIQTKSINRYNKKIRLHSLDPERRLIDHVIIGCSGRWPPWLITVYVPRLKDFQRSAGLFGFLRHEESSLEVNPLRDSDDGMNNSNSMIQDCIGTTFLWKINARTSAIDYSFTPRELFYSSSEFASVPILSVTSVWSLTFNSIVQVLLRCEDIQYRSSTNDWTLTPNETRSTLLSRKSYDREIIEFRCGPSESCITWAGTGEFDGEYHRTSFELFDRYGIILVSLNSRVFIYHSTQRRISDSALPPVDCAKTTVTNGCKFWYSVPDTELLIPLSPGARLSVIELDYYIEHTYPKHIFKKPATDAESSFSALKKIKFDEFAIRLLRPTSSGGQILLLGALSKKMCIFVVCILLLDIPNETISVLKLYRLDTIKLKANSISTRYTAQDLLNRALQSNKISAHYPSYDENLRSHCNLKLLYDYERHKDSTKEIELFELDLTIASH